MRRLVFSDDVEQARCFFTELYAPYQSPRAFVEIRTFVKPFPRRWFPVTPEGLAGAAAFAVSLRDRFDVFMGVLPRINGGGGSEHLRLAGWLWVDLDAGNDDLPTVCALLRSGLEGTNIPEPDLVVVSGFGLHCYWRLGEPVTVRSEADRDRLRKINARLGLLFNEGTPIHHNDKERLSHAHACPKATEAARVLRVPGTFNRKRADLPDPAERQERMVRLVRCTVSASARPLVWWDAHLPAMPLPPSLRRSPIERKTYSGASSSSRGPSLPPGTQAKIAGGGTQGTRHYTMRDVAISARKEGYEEHEIAAFVEATARASGVNMESSDEQKHAQGLVEWAMRNVVVSPFEPTRQGAAR